MYCKKHNMLYADGKDKNADCPDCVIDYLRSELEQEQNARVYAEGQLMNAPCVVPEHESLVQELEQVNDILVDECKRTDDFAKQLETVRYEFGITKQELARVRERADLNEKALKLACECIRLHDYMSKEERFGEPHYFYKKAQEVK